MVHKDESSCSTNTLIRLLYSATVLLNNNNNFKNLMVTFSTVMLRAYLSSKERITSQEVPTVHNAAISADEVLIKPVQTKDDKVKFT